jgi:hypothetical protein
MRTELPSLTRRLLPAVVFCAALPALAQSPAGQVSPAESAPMTGGDKVRVERITHEDALSRIDELRVGGQTRSIDVTPKNGAPGYEIQPASGAESTTDAPGNGGRSRWRILSF